MTDFANILRAKRTLTVDMQQALRDHQIDITIVITGARRMQLRLAIARILFSAGARLLCARVFVENQTGAGEDPKL